MARAGRWLPLIGLVVTLGVVAPPPVRAQLEVADREALDFDRPESWGMKYYASLALLTGMGVPRKQAAGAVELGFEGGHVPQLSEAERRLGFGGTKVEDVNKTSFFGRVRGSVGLGKGFALELAYTPPIEVGGARPNIFALALGRAVELAPSWRLGVRGHGQLGTIETDVTCSTEEVAAGDDVQANPFHCVQPSQDQTRQKVVGLELAVGYDGASRLKPYAGLGLNYMDLEFRINAVYSGGLVEDHSIQTTSGATVYASAGLSFAASSRFLVTAELFYSWLSIVRPPAATSANEGLLNGRVFVSYRVH